jgi:hypothetical protein
VRLKIENANNLIENRTRDIPACSIVPHPTRLPHAAVGGIIILKSMSEPEWIGVAIQLPTTILEVNPPNFGWASRLRFLVVFLSPSKQMLG